MTFFVLNNKLIKYRQQINKVQFFLIVVKTLVKTHQSYVNKLKEINNLICKIIRKQILKNLHIKMTFNL